MAAAGPQTSVRARASIRTIVTDKQVQFGALANPDVPWLVDIEAQSPFSLRPLSKFFLLLFLQHSSCSAFMIGVRQL